MTHPTATGGRRLRDYLADSLVVGEPDIAGPLAVYPVSGPACRQSFVAFSQANGKVVIGEADSASVRDLTVFNHGDDPVLLYEGEEVLGGQQHRSVDVTILVAANAKLSMPVSCVEAGRWDHRSHRARFAASPHSPSPQLRRSKSDRVRASLAADGAGYADQGEVWGLVDSISARLGSSSRTRAFSDTYEHRRDDLRKIQRAIRLRDGQLGAVVAVGGEFCVLDVVGRPDVFAALHSPLAQGYALEALANGASDKPTPELDAAREVVGAALGAKGDERPSLGLGTDVRFARRNVAGSALVHNGELVQLTAFPRGSKPTTRIGRPLSRRTRRQ